MRNHLIKFWMPLAIASTVIMVTVYAAVQQNYRQSANDPQIQMSEDGAAFLSAGGSPTTVIGSAHTDIHASLAPFAIVYDDSGKVLASSGYLAGNVPLLPAGVLGYVRSNVSDRITWQPASTTRVAAVVRRFQVTGPSSVTSGAVFGAASGTASGFILVGRNLREVEGREHQLELMCAAALVAVLVLTLLISVYSYLAEQRREEILEILGE